MAQETPAYATASSALRWLTDPALPDASQSPAMTMLAQEHWCELPPGTLPFR